MSFEAMNWARRQTCGVTARKAVLLALANWADAEGFVKRIRIDYLEQTTELSWPGVYLRLRELEAGGAITRSRQKRARRLRDAQSRQWLSNAGRGWVGRSLPERVLPVRQRRDIIRETKPSQQAITRDTKRLSPARLI
jgi:hypothetical protein